MSADIGLTLEFPLNHHHRCAQISEYHHHENVVNNVNEPINNNYNCMFEMFEYKWWPKQSWCCTTIQMDGNRQKEFGRDLWLFSKHLLFFRGLFCFILLQSIEHNCCCKYIYIYSTHGYFLLSQTHATYSMELSFGLIWKNSIVFSQQWKDCC